MIHPPEAVLASMMLASAGITGWLSDKDWERMIGPWGGLLISVAMVGTLLRHSAESAGSTLNHMLIFGLILTGTSGTFALQLANTAATGTVTRTAGIMRITKL